MSTFLFQVNNQLITALFYTYLLFNLQKLGLYKDENCIRLCLTHPRFVLRSDSMATTADMASLPTVLICEAGRMKP